MMMDFDAVMKAFEKRFGEDWVILIRMHPNNITNAEKFIQYSDRIINATNYNNMQELLVASDVLITDYSSSMFDFATTEKPCFIYATDIEKNIKECGFYFDIMELPFSVAQDTKKLVQNITEFNNTAYKKRLQKLFDKVGLCDTGTACRRTVNGIKKVVEKSY